ncbi:TrmH family RNA methyltransferase [Brevibacterium sanguinis]|uniref:TrmH family RNA methyltransferase n=2 Tax=Brevibacterium TaxID=1696 RepID=A0A366INV3_9MICO|nr:MULTISPECIES: RNA methyltransferase [Brevibacterium]RBP67828.1 TrmH family RNA methyltransferase [Brevibacterium sanguinis]RBP74755.1 TrmH family RNA methyltransferase [Brevibacterium celere]
MKLPDVITSPQSKRIKSALRLLRRNHRKTTGQFLVEGPQAVREALERHVELGLQPQNRIVTDVVGSVGERNGAVLELFITEEASERHPEFVETVRAQRIRWNIVAEDVLTELATTVNSQGVVAVCAQLDVELTSVMTKDAQLIVVLSQVRDPGNAGTIIRLADAAGANAVVLTSSSVDVYNDKTVRSTAGSLFHVPVVTGVGLAEVTELARARGLQVLAADANDEAHDLHHPWDSGLDLSARTAWVFGNEAWGMKSSDLEQCDASVAVPIYGQAESLNLATAASVCIYESARNQRM